MDRFFHSGIGSSSVGVSLGKGNPVTLDQNRVHFHCHVKRGLAEIPRALGLDCVVSAGSCTVFSLDQIAQSASFFLPPNAVGHLEHFRLKTLGSRQLGNMT